MLYNDYIKNLRAQTGDVRRRVTIAGPNWVADGIKTTFQVPKDSYPIYDVAGTYIVKIAGTAQVETTDYTLDKEAGTLVFATAPAAGSQVSLDASAVHITNAGWITIITNVMLSLGDDYWKEFVAEGSFSNITNEYSFDLTPVQALCIAVYEFQTRANTSEQWRPAEDDMNWRFDRDNNIIYLGLNDIIRSGNLYRIRGLRKYVTDGVTIAATMDVQDEFLTVIEMGALARYWKYRYKSVVELVSKQSLESSRTPLQELIMLADRFDRDFEREKARLKPQKPARLIPVYKQGGGRP